jgi:hypothetical protein
MSTTNTSVSVPLMPAEDAPDEPYLKLIVMMLASPDRDGG